MRQSRGGLWGWVTSTAKSASNWAGNTAKSAWNLMGSSDAETVLGIAGSVACLTVATAVCLGVEAATLVAETVAQYTTRGRADVKGDLINAAGDAVGRAAAIGVAARGLKLAEAAGEEVPGLRRILMKSPFQTEKGGAHELGTAGRKYLNVPITITNIGVNADGKIKVLVRTDAAGATHAFTTRIDQLGMQFSVGAYLHHFDIHAIPDRIPKKAWTSAYNADGKPRDGAWVVEVTGLADLSTWPGGIRL